MGLLYMKSWLMKAGSVVAVSVVTLVVGAGTALAHVTVSSPTATQGGYGVLVFRVPTESDTASTVGLKIQLPTDTPMAYVGVQPKAGWNYNVVRSTLPTPIQTDDGPVTEAVTEVDWTATAAGIAPGEFDQFQLFVGPFPETPTVMFKAIQHYSDNTDVAWIEVPAAGSAEPAHPAPTLTLLAAAAATTADSTTAQVSASTGSGSSAASAPGGVTVSATTTEAAAGDTPSKGSVTVAIVLAVIGLVLGAVGVAFGLASRRSRARIGSGS